MAACSGKSIHPPIKADLVHIFTLVGGDLPALLDISKGFYSNTVASKLL